MPGRNLGWIPEERASFKGEKSSRVASLEESGAATQDLRCLKQKTLWWKGSLFVPHNTSSFLFLQEGFICFSFVS